MRLTIALLTVQVLVPTLAAAQAARELRIDMSSSTAPAPRELQVNDWSRVIVAVDKNMFHACTVETKTEALPAPVNPVGQILSILGGFIGGGGVASERADPTDNLGRQVEALIDEIVAVRMTLDSQHGQVTALTRRLPDSVACGAPVGGQDPCEDVPMARGRLETLATDIQATPKDPIASTSLLSARAAELAKALMARALQDPPDPNLSRTFARLRTAQEQIDAANGRRDAIVKARDALLVVRERVLGFSPGKTVRYPLSPVGNSRSVATVSCVNIVTQQPVIYFRRPDAESDGANVQEKPPERLAPVSGTVVFRNIPWATVTGGLLSSSVDKREIGIATVKTGTDPATNVVTFDRRVAVVEEGDSQLIPFTFFNLVVPRVSSHRVYVAGSLGFGLNPHNGPKHLEYFLGGAVGIGRFVAINAGFHFGTRMEPVGGFSIDDILPSTLTTVPTRRERERGLAIAISYGVPLPK